MARPEGDDPCAESGKLTRPPAAVRIEEHHVATGDGAERLERPRDLPLDVDAFPEATPQPCVGGERKVGHPAQYTDVPRRPGLRVGRLWQNRAVLQKVRAMPNSVRLFLAYGIVVLAVIGLLLPGVVALAVQMPVTGPGVVLMLLLAYTIFTLTLVLQRKRAARWLALGLSSLTLPAALFLVLVGEPIGALAALALAAGLLLGLTTPGARAYFDQE